MICPLCKKLKVKKLKTIKGVEIFECENCKLGFAINSTTMSRPLQSCNGLYDFKEYKQQENRLSKRYEKLAKNILKYKTSGKILDIGAGFGLFSSILNKKGSFQFDLIEPDNKPYFLEKEIKKKKQFKLYKTGLERFISNKTSVKYDLIIILDVIEHFEDPLKNLKRIKPLLKKDGLLIIQTPNYKSLMAMTCKNWAWWMVEDHKFFFSPKSIRLLVGKAGFVIGKIQTYEDFYEFKKNLDGNFTDIKNPFTRKISKLFYFSIFTPFYFIFRKFIWKSGYGGLMFIILKR